MSRRVFAVPFALVFAASAAGAASDGEVLRLRATRLVQAGRCAEAMPLLDRIAPDDPAAGGAARLRGQCALRERRYAEAAAALEDAQRRGAAPPEAVVELAIARFHSGDLDGAQQALDAVRGERAGDPAFQLYDGLLRLQRAESREAADALARARSLGPGSVDPIASYYEGLAWAAADETDEARRALERVRELYPGSPWAEEAARVLERLEQGAARRAWISARLGFEYDDNVVLLADGVSLPSDISGSHDVRGVLRLHAGAEWLRTRDWSSGITITHYADLYQDLEDFNLQQPIVSLWLDRRLAEDWVTRTELGTGYAWVGGSEPFLWSQEATQSLYRDFGDAGTTRLAAGFYRANYLFPPSDDVPDFPCVGTPCGPPGVNEAHARNRDGNGLLAGVEHSVVGPLGIVFNAGYVYHRFSARGSEYSYQGHQVWLRTLTPLPWKFSLETLVDYTYQPYRHASTFPDPADVAATPNGVQYPLSSNTRRDDIELYEVALERPFGDHVLGSIRYAYERNNSNVDVFEYDREILGAYVTVHFDR